MLATVLCLFALASAGNRQSHALVEQAATSTDAALSLSTPNVGAMMQMTVFEPVGRGLLP